MAFFILIVIFLRFKDSLVTEYSNMAVQFLTATKNIPNLEIKSLNFTTAKLSGFNTIEWQDISSTIIITNNKKFMSNHKIPIHIKSLKLKLNSIFNKEFILTADNINANLSINNNSLEERDEFFFENLKKGKLTITFYCNFLQPGTIVDQFRQLYKKVSIVLKSEKTDILFDFSGICSLTIKNELIKAKVTTKCDNTGCELIVNKEFFKLISWLMEEDLTDPEIVLLSRNPFRVSKLLNIRNIAQRESERENNKNRSISKDAYRHVLWSFLLTKAYGPIFSKKVTDAHEEGDINNTEAEHRMDFNNNIIGRQYALSKYKRDKVLYHLLYDPKIIRFAQ